MDYRYGSHTVFQIEYHFVWVTKYRYKVLTGEVGERVRELVRQVCSTFEIRIVKGVVSRDYRDGMNMASLFPRRIKPSIAEALLDTPVVLLAGPRQSGKTTLVRQIAKQHGLRYLTMEIRDR